MKRKNNSSIKIKKILFCTLMCALMCAYNTTPVGSGEPSLVQDTAVQVLACNSQVGEELEEETAKGNSIPKAAYRERSIISNE